MNANRTNTWVEWFLQTSQRRYFVQIDQNFIHDAFNFYGLRPYVNNYKYSTEMIRGDYTPRSQRNSDIPPDTEKDAKKIIQFSSCPISNNE